MLAPPSDPDDEVSVASSESLNSASSAALGISSSATPFSCSKKNMTESNDGDSEPEEVVREPRPTNVFGLQLLNAETDIQADLVIPLESDKGLGEIVFNDERVRSQNILGFPIFVWTLKTVPDHPNTYYVVMCRWWWVW